MSDTPEVRKASKIVPVPTIHFSDGPLAGTVIRLDQDEATLGRRTDNAYVISDPRISRVHATVRKEAGAVIITDLGSSGGTSVNDEEISGPTVLDHGDKVGFGPIVGVFEDPAAASKGEETTEVLEVPKVETGPHLSPRQQQVLELMAEGMTNAEIGDQLGVTERTVKAYAQELYDKLGVRNRAGAVAEAAKLGLL
ncbi:LuxR C-terminal-related transcriptional regulator [Salsipaludibacter albus]|uniref:LuxR C-terminal-related transcriptional regulator n=1 Tax=Salsipaludibacter albus TaxID=2849650 RepID=UPI001EE44D2F|nr:LuxR C-terminal-related transcriptional regulator [Salsipaludibacter albus]